MGGDENGGRLSLKNTDGKNDPIGSTQNSAKEEVAGDPSNPGNTSANLGQAQNMVASIPGDVIRSIYSKLLRPDFADLISRYISPGATLTTVLDIFAALSICSVAAFRIIFVDSSEKEFREFTREELKD